MTSRRNKEKCRICGNALSIYNKEGACHFHFLPKDAVPDNVSEVRQFKFSSGHSGNAAIITQIKERG